MMVTSYVCSLFPDRDYKYIDHQRTTFISSTWNRKCGCCVRILYSVYSVAKLWIGEPDKSHGHFKNFTVTLIFILLFTDGHVIKGGGGVRMDIGRGVDENQCDIKILEMAVRFVSLADSKLGNPVYTVQISYRITRSWFQVDEINVVLWWSNIFIMKNDDLAESSLL